MAFLARGSAPPLSERLRGWGPLGVLAVVVVIAADLVVKPLSAIAALVWARLSGTPLRELGLVRPRSWPVALILGVFLGILLKLLLKAVVMPLLGAPPTNEAYAFLIGNTAALPGMLYVIVVGAGFGEEVVHRGFLFERARSLLRDSRHATAVAVVVTSVLFGLAHYPEQGVPGVQQGIIVGFAYALMRVRTGSLAMPIAAHIAFDIVAVAIIYWNLEATVAHWVF